MVMAAIATMAIVVVLFGLSAWEGSRRHRQPQMPVRLAVRMAMDIATVSVGQTLAHSHHDAPPTGVRQQVDEVVRIE